MAILTPSQLQAASNTTYFDNTSGSITPATVRSLNNDWISSSILVSQTASLNVLSASFAGTASVLLGSVVSASHALVANLALNANAADTATFASTAATANSAVTASFALNFNPFATASFAINAATASVLLGFVESASYAANAELLDGLNSTVFVLTSSFNPITASVSSLNSATSSYVTNSQTSSLIVASASFATSASYAVSSSNSVSASNSISSSNAITASLAINANTASFVLQSISASYSNNAELLDGLNSTAFVFTSSFNTFSGSVANQFANTPKLDGNNTYTGNNIFANVTASNVLVNGSVNTSAGFTGSLFGNASTATTASYAIISTPPFIVTNQGSSRYIINGTDKPVLTFVPGQNYRFDLSGIVGSHPFKFSLAPNGPTQYTYGVTSGSEFIEINVDYATSQSLYYYCTNHSGMGNEANTLREENLINNSQTSSMSVATASFATSASFTTTASFATFTTTASFATIANSVNILSQSLTITGSVRGNVISQSISSNTCSIDCNLGSFFTCLASGSTHYNIVNNSGGQTVNLLLTTNGVPTASFSTNVKQASGSFYAPTSGSNNQDILTFVTFNDATRIYLANIKKFI